MTPLELAERLDAAAPRLETTARDIARLSAEKRGLEMRKDRITADVSQAKWRAEQKDQVEKIFELAQARFHARAVGSFERLLTGIANDILPSQIEIKLDLGTSRGKPALDIIAMRPDGPVNVSRATGGSIQNVISTGLRAAAVIKTKKRRFLALDEAECWIKPDHIPAYGGVLNRLSHDLNLQILLVTHHDPALFPGAHIVRLDGRPETGLTAIEQTIRPAPSGASDPKAFASLRLQNFMSHEDTVIPFSPYVTCFVGDNDIGKSAAIAGLRAIGAGDFIDSDIRHNASSSTITLTLVGGAELSVTRSAKRNVKMQWKLRHADGSEQTTEGSEPPDFIEKLTNFAHFGDIDIATASQNPSVFLIDEPASKRAEILSVGHEGAHLDALMDRWKRLTQKDASTIRDGEAELSKILVRLRDLDKIETISTQFELLQTTSAEISQDILELHSISASKDELAFVQTARRQLEDQQAILTQLASAPTIHEAVSIKTAALDLAAAVKARIGLETENTRLADLQDAPSLNDASELFKCASDLSRQRAARISASQNLAVLNHLAEPPCLADLAPAKTLAGALSIARADYNHLARQNEIFLALPISKPEFADTALIMDKQSELATSASQTQSLVKTGTVISQELVTTQREIEALNAANHHRCPTCGAAGFDPLAHQHA